MKKIFLAQGIVVAATWKIAEGSSVSELVKDLVPHGDVLVVQTEDKMKVFGKDANNELRSKCMPFQSPEERLKPILLLIKTFGKDVQLSGMQIEERVLA